MLWPAVGWAERLWRTLPAERVPTSHTVACPALVLSCHRARGALQPAAGSGCSLHRLTSSSSRSRVSPVFANLPVYACVENLFGQETDTPRQIVLILIDGRTQLLCKQKKKRRNVWYMEQAATLSVGCTGQNVHSPAVQAELLHKIPPMPKATLATSEGQSRSAASVKLCTKSCPNAPE